MHKLPIRGTKVRAIRLDDGVELRPAFVAIDQDRHGNVRVYYRRRGKKTRIADLSSAEAFLLQYKAAATGLETKRPESATADEESLTWLAEQYYRSDTFAALDKRTRYVFDATSSTTFAPAGATTRSG